MNAFEDIGYYCLDHLPPALLAELVPLAERAGIERVALSLDVLAHGAFGDPVAALDQLQARGIPVEVLYLDANDESIVRRYSETRRRHPRETSGDLRAAIANERGELEPFRSRAAQVWDTSHLTQAELRAKVIDAYAAEPGERRLAVRVVAFGFKFGLPLDADLVFDARFFPNPNYVPELQPLSGRDRPVAEFMEALPQTAPFLAHLFALMDFLVPHYVAEGKARLTIAIGCTGGRHRSVYIAERLAEHLAVQSEITVTRAYRELSRA